MNFRAEYAGQGYWQQLGKRPDATDLWRRKWTPEAMRQVVAEGRAAHAEMHRKLESMTQGMDRQTRVR